MEKAYEVENLFLSFGDIHTYSIETICSLYKGKIQS